MHIGLGLCIAARSTDTAEKTQDMVKNDTPPPTPSDVVEALALLTRLPVPAGDGTRGAAAAWAYPLVGVVIGGIAAVAGAIAYWLALPPLLCALLSLATMIVLTGAMHEDGLADTADGLWGGWTREARLEIMKDSHIGTYGVLALILSVAARWGALWLLFEAGVGLACAALIVGAAVSRGAMPALMAYLPQCPRDGPVAKRRCGLPRDRLDRGRDCGACCSSLCRAVDVRRGDMGRSPHPRHCHGRTAQDRWADR